MPANLMMIRGEIEGAVLKWTHRRVRNLKVVVGTEKVVLHGETDTYYSKQLAQEGVRDLFPDLPFRNDISVR